jgi:hypothetical protein
MTANSSLTADTYISPALCLQRSVSVRDYRVAPTTRPLADVQI